MIDERVWDLIKDELYVDQRGLNYTFKVAMIKYNLKYEQLRCPKCQRLVMDCDNKHELKLIQGEKK